MISLKSKIRPKRFDEIYMGFLGLPDYYVIGTNQKFNREIADYTNSLFTDEIGTIVNFMWIYFLNYLIK